jgi:hypothetical protein
VLRRSFRIGLTLGLLAGVAFALSKLLGGRASSQPEPRSVGAPSSWPPLQPEPAPTIAATTALVPDPEAPKTAAAPPKKAAAPKAAAPTATTAWVEPSGDVCPTTHPVKAKLSSKIFHLPGMLNYDRTKPDRCYSDAPSAEADGLRPAKR